MSSVSSLAFFILFPPTTGNLILVMHLASSSSAGSLSRVIMFFFEYTSFVFFCANRLHPFTAHTSGRRMAKAIDIQRRIDSGMSVSHAERDFKQLVDEYAFRMLLLFSMSRRCTARKPPIPSLRNRFGPWLPSLTLGISSRRGAMGCEQKTSLECAAYLFSPFIQNR